MLKILAFGNADKKLSINFLTYLIGCEVLDANAVLRKVNAKIVLLPGSVRSSRRINSAV